MKKMKINDNSINSFFSPKKQITVNDILYDNAYRTTSIAAILFFLLNMYYLITDLIRDFYSQPHTWLNLIAILMILSSSILLILSRLFSKKISSNRKHILVLMFYLVLVIVVGIFAYTNNVRAIDAGASADFSGITLSSFYFILFILAPLPNKTDGIIINSLIFFIAVLLCFLPGNEFFGVFREFSYRAIVILGYFIQRKKALDAAKDQVDNISLLRKLSINSYVDQLTKSLNRHALEKYFNELAESANGKNIGVIMIDIDNFKSYNDVYNHNAGDIVLTNVSEVISKSLTDKDKYLFRFGGEEFIVIVMDCEENELIDYAKKYGLAIYNKNIHREDDKVFDRVTISIGCESFIYSSNMSIADFIEKADIQLYNAKKNGKNCLSYNKEIYLFIK